MKDLTGYLIIAGIITAMIIAQLIVNRHIEKNGGKVETIFNTPTKEVIEL